jgi:putative membrane protein
MSARRRLLPLACIAALALACPRNEQSVAPSDTVSTATSASDTASTVSPADVGTSGSSSTGATGGTVSTLSEAEKTFVMRTGIAGMAEVAAGKSAIDKATAADVKAFATRMVADHTKANEELKGFVMNKGVALPTELDDAHKSMAATLDKSSGAAFDHAYIQAMIADHEKAVSDFETMSTQATDPDLKTWVTKTLPTLREHLAMAKKMSR